MNKYVFAVANHQEHAYNNCECDVVVAVTLACDSDSVNQRRSCDEAHTEVYKCYITTEEITNVVSVCH